MRRAKGDRILLAPSFICESIQLSIGMFLIKFLPERERRQRSIRLVTGQIGHRCTPKIVLENVFQRINGEHVFIKSHSRDVIVHEIAVQTVQVTANGYGAHQAVYRPTAGELPSEFILSNG